MSKWKNKIRRKRTKKKDIEEHTVSDNSGRLPLLADAAPKNEVAIDFNSTFTYTGAKQLHAVATRVKQRLANFAVIVKRDCPRSLRRLMSLMHHSVLHLGRILSRERFLSKELSGRVVELDEVIEPSLQPCVARRGKFTCAVVVGHVWFMTNFATTNLRQSVTATKSVANKMDTTSVARFGKKLSV
ncbi:hypothetical protein ZWY2020_051810 [Hordeum vulgare]|nr:hypothetical protein ZWY2020_051810 [Hordeum vulgare]